MFDMDVPWWELVARAVMVYGALLVMIRLSGKRTVGQFTPFDLLVVMLLSESVSSSLAGGDDSIPGGLILAGTLITLNVSLAMLGARSRRVAKLLDGEPVLLGRDGEIYEQAVRRAHVPLGEVEQALREENTELKKMKYIFLETDGKITVIHDD